MAERTDDVNTEVVDDWVEETTPYQRVRSVMRRTYEPEPVDEMADRARTSPTTARKHLRNLTEEGFVVETAEPDQNGALYKRSEESLVLEQAKDMLDEVGREELLTRIHEIEEALQTYRDEWDAESPEDAVLQETGIDAESLQEWQTTERNLGFARVALELIRAVGTAGEVRRTQ